MRRLPRNKPVIGYAPRTLGRLAVLLFMVVLIVLLAVRLRDPRGWAWLAAGKGLPEEPQPAAGPKPPDERKSPDPDMDTLLGAADWEPFLVENENFLVQDERWDRQRRDAAARYQLLLCAKMAEPGSLFHDARRDVRHADLVEQPNAHRGEVIHIRGDLLWVRTMELRRQQFGMKTCYQGLITVQHPDRAYWILFTDLPPGLPDPKGWGSFYLPNVEFAGYFYKLLSVEPARGEQGPRHLPVLVGKTLRIPDTKPPADDIAMLVGIFLAAAAPVLLIALLAWWLYRRGDRSLQAKMAQVRQRAENRDEKAVERLGEADGSTPEPHHNGSEARAD